MWLRAQRRGIGLCVAVLLVQGQLAWLRELGLLRRVLPDELLVQTWIWRPVLVRPEERAYWLWMALHAELPVRLWWQALELLMSLRWQAW